MRSIDQANSRPGLAGSPPAVSQAIEGIARLTRTCTSHEVSSEVTRKCDAGVPSLPSIGSTCGSVNPAPARSARTAHSATWARSDLGPPPASGMVADVVGGNGACTNAIDQLDICERPHATFRK